MILENTTHGKALSAFEAKYYSISSSYNTEIAVVECGGHKSYAMLSLDLNAISNVLITDHKYFLSNSYNKESDKWLQKLTTTIPRANYIEGVLITDHYFAPESIVTVETLSNMDDLEDYLISEDNAKFTWFNSRAVQYDIKHIYSGMATIVFADPKDGFKEYQCYVLPYFGAIPENSEELYNGCPKEFDKRYMTRAFMLEYGNSLMSKGATSYLMLSDIPEVNIVSSQHEDDVVNHGMYEIRENAYEIINDEYEFMIASKDGLPKGLPIMAIYSSS